MKQQKKICAVVLAGGFGTRLGPLTDIKPKPLVRILDTPVISDILCRIGKTKVDKIIVSTCYHAEKIESLCKEKFPDVQCKKECVPLGTAGGVKFCADSTCDAFLVVSGDAVFDFDLQTVIDFHFENKSDVTVAASRKEDPTGYGVIVADENSDVVGFCEKPSWNRVRSDLVNTGIYVLSKNALDSIPCGMKYDFSNNLFPKLMKEGKKIKVFAPNGFWCDIGTFDEYFECNLMAAQGKLSCIKNYGQNAAQLRMKGVHADDGVYVSDSCITGRNVSILRGAVVCENTHIGDNCDISMSIVGALCRIGKGSTLSGAIVGEESVVGENCIIPEGCVVGDGCRIADGTVLKKNERITAQSVVGGREKEKMFFSNKTGIFVDDGLCVLDKDCEYDDVLRLARAVAACYATSAVSGGFFAITADKSASFAAKLFMSELAKEKNHVFDCHEGNPAMCSYITQKLGADAGICFFTENERINISFCSRDGSVLCSNEERKISKVFSLAHSTANNLQSVNGGNFECINIPAESLYEAEMLQFARRMMKNSDFSGISFFVSPKEKEKNITLAPLERVLVKMSAMTCETGGKNVINISSGNGGKRLTIRIGNEFLDHEHVLALILKNKEHLGIEKMFVGENAPTVLKNMSENHTQKTPEAQNFVFSDAAFACIALLSAMKIRGKDIDELLREIPLFEVFRDEFIGDVNRGAAVERLSRLYYDSKDDGGDGIRLSLADGNVTVIPDRIRGLKIISEAQSMEVARELCMKITNVIKGKE